MAAIAHSPSFAKKVGIPQSVGKDFNEADKGRKFSKGGDTMASKMNPGFMAMMAKKKGAMGGMAAFEKSGKDVEKKGMKEGSKADMAMDKKQMVGMKKGGMAKGCGYSKGGQLAKANGVAVRGKTKGTIYTYFYKV